MNGLTEDLLNLVAREIAGDWDKLNGDLDWFVNKVKSTPLTVEDLNRYLHEHGDTCPECVNQVFAAIVYADLRKRLAKEEKGGEL